MSVAPVLGGFSEIANGGVVTLPSSPTEGSVMVAVTLSGVDAQASIEAMGWTTVYYAYDGDWTGDHLGLFTKIAGASEPSVHDFDLEDFNDKVIIVTFSDANTSVPLSDYGHHVEFNDAVIEPIDLVAGGYHLVIAVSDNSFTIDFSGNGFTVLGQDSSYQRATLLGRSIGSDETPSATFTDTQVYATPFIFSIGIAPAGSSGPTESPLSAYSGQLSVFGTGSLSVMTASGPVPI